MDTQTEIQSQVQAAQRAARSLATASSEQKNRALAAMASMIERQEAAVLDANRLDVEQGQKAGRSAALIDRLTLDPKRIAAMVQGIRQVAQLPEPVGRVLDKQTRPNGLEITKVSVPLGVIAMIFESRPNVTADAAALCLKAGNAVILRGGSESLRSNISIGAALQAGLDEAGLPSGSIQVVQTTDRDAVRILAQMEGKVDLIIPRGGESLIRAVQQVATVPVIKHYKGVCHIFVDETAQLDSAIDICENAKCQRPGVCNAMETLLVHRSVAAQFLPMLAQRLGSYPVILKADEAARAILTSAEPATEADWSTEYLDLILSIRIVDSLDTAIEHINQYGSHHSDSILTANQQHAGRFLSEVDSAAVYVNASTRFTDGFEFGLGAEIGISTDKLHARGPMGIQELTTYKYIVRGNQHVRK